MFFAMRCRRPSPRRSLCGRDHIRRLEQLEERTLLSTSALQLAAQIGAAFGSDADTRVKVVDVIPGSLSGETDQNSEPSIAVNPTNPTQAAISAFSNDPTSNSPFFSTADGGKTWVAFDHKVSYDTTLSWSMSGTLYMARSSNIVLDKTGIPSTGTIEVDKSSSPAPPSSTPFSTISGSAYTTPPNTGNPDQPHVVAARVGGTDHIYVGFNDELNYFLRYPIGNKASLRFSTDGGAHWENVVIDQGTAPSLGDGPSVRVGVNGKTVYAVFQRVLSYDPKAGVAYGQVVVMRDDYAGEGQFKALGADGSTVASGYAPGQVTIPKGGIPTSLGNERLNSDLSLAVDPHDASHVYVAYADIPGFSKETNRIQVHVRESTDGGATWVEKFTTSTADKAALPALAVANSGAVGLLYTAQHIDDAGNSFLETHFVQTGDDFASSTDILLSRFADGNPPKVFEPYIGDYQGLVAIGNTFYGTFSASNRDDGVNGFLPSGALFQRDFTGIPGTSSFKLTDGSGTDGSGKPVDFSIDPFYFQIPAVSTHGSVKTSR